MKTEKRITEKKIIEPIEYNVYITKDGKEFKFKDDAERHEAKLKREKLIKYFEDNYHYQKIKEYLDIEGIIYTIYIDKEIDDKILDDIKKLFPYYAYRDNSKDMKRFRKGWQIIVEEEWDSDYYGPWSGYSINIYYPEEIIEEKEQQIEVLKRFI